MRITPTALALGSMLMIGSSGGYSALGTPSMNVKSVALVQAGKAALALPDGASVAEDDFETALSLDPQNRDALLGLARAAMKQQLPGKAIRFYRAALALNPSDLQALAGQGEALVAKGAFVKANENLAKINNLCVSRCPEQIALSNVIARGTIAPPVSAAAITLKPSVSVAN